MANPDKSSRLPAQLLHTSLLTLAQWPRASSSSVIYVFCQNVLIICLDKLMSHTYGFACDVKIISKVSQFLS